ncbi:MAG TPA: hypothetical protein VGR06_23270 [Actinophytocola sp.]|uniref:hypothetical protein n=1 Tax=Actinophytocola sp. TaxID=1872138 RepID=UPI002E057AD4|nr:hypothetical protein [Actinophytocola sp.]
MHLNALGQSLRFLVIIQKVGRGDLGVLAATTYAEVLEKDQQQGSWEFRRAFEPTPKDQVTLVWNNRPQDLWPAVAELIDRTLSTALKFFVDQLS